MLTQRLASIFGQMVSKNILEHRSIHYACPSDLSLCHEESLCSYELVHCLACSNFHDRFYLWNIPRNFFNVDLCKMTRSNNWNNNKNCLPVKLYTKEKAIKRNLTLAHRSFPDGLLNKSGSASETPVQTSENWNSSVDLLNLLKVYQNAMKPSFLVAPKSLWNPTKYLESFGNTPELI